MRTSRPARPCAVVTGMIASYPLGGVVFDYGQYLVGLEALGYDVYYLEDTGWTVFDPRTGKYGDDYDFGLDYLEQALSFMSPKLAERWAVRRMDGVLVGPAADRLPEILKEAELFLNVSGGTVLRDDYMNCGVTVLIDTDPGFNQMHNYPKQDAFAALERGDARGAAKLLADAGLQRLAEDMDGWFAASGAWRGAHSYREYDHHFTYAERMGASDCLVPTLGLDWRPTRPPVALDLWSAGGGGRHWTSVMSWRTIEESINHCGRVYGGKEREFARIEGLAARSGLDLQIAVGGVRAPRERWRALGWDVMDAVAVSTTPTAYRDYILGSRGEFAIAKNVYVDTRSGWFSCRSVCYLAAGLPVVVQDTGFSAILPTGAGLLAFNDAEEALAALRAVEADYGRHRKAARDVAYDCFRSDAVLVDILRRVGLR
ncbi:MAG: hypothetical protein JWQ07_5383 [Ramlibacter sp.]|nr:hypothetical protein [Ramlibacter sp.]